jgi:hypothetical protein
MPFSPHLKISLRTLMLLVLAVAAWLGWSIHKARQQRMAVASIKECGGSVRYDWEFDDDFGRPLRTRWEPHWLRRLVGVEHFQDIACVRLQYDPAKHRDDPLRHLEGFSGLRELSLIGPGDTDQALWHIRGHTRLRFLNLLRAPKLTDAGLSYIRGLTRLQGLSTSDAKQLTDAGVAHLAGLRNLKSLHLCDSKMTDVGLAHLKGLTNLEELGIDNTRVTDEGLEHLRRLPKLKALMITRTAITVDGVKRLQGAIPSLTYVSQPRVVFVPDSSRGFVTTVRGYGR